MRGGGSFLAGGLRLAVRVATAAVQDRDSVPRFASVGLLAEATAIFARLWLLAVAEGVGTLMIDFHGGSPVLAPREMTVCSFGIKRM
jgi:hypothetical protein